VLFRPIHLYGNRVNQDLSLAAMDITAPTRAARPQLNRIAGSGLKNSVPGRRSN